MIRDLFVGVLIALSMLYMWMIVIGFQATDKVFKDVQSYDANSNVINRKAQ